MLGKEDAIIIGCVILLFIEIIMIIKKIPIKRNFMIIIFSMYIVMLISIVFFPIPYQLKGYDCGYNFIPFLSIREYFIDGGAYSNISLLGNIALLIPWGCLLGFVIKNVKRRTFWLLTVFVSVGIEIIQHLINTIIGYRYRCVDIDDFILNMLGATIGYFLYLLIYKKIDKIIFDE